MTNDKHVSAEIMAAAIKASKQTFDGVEHEIFINILAEIYGSLGKDYDTNRANFVRATMEARGLEIRSKENG